MTSIPFEMYGIPFRMIQEQMVKVWVNEKCFLRMDRRILYEVNRVEWENASRAFVREYERESEREIKKRGLSRTVDPYLFIHNWKFIDWKFISPVNNVTQYCCWIYLSSFILTSQHAIRDFYLTYTNISFFLEKK